MVVSDMHDMKAAAVLHSRFRSPFPVMAKQQVPAFVTWAVANTVVVASGGFMSGEEMEAGGFPRAEDGGGWWVSVGRRRWRPVVFRGFPPGEMSMIASGNFPRGGDGGRWLSAGR